MSWIRGWVRGLGLCVAGGAGLLAYWLMVPEPVAAQGASSDAARAAQEAAADPDAPGPTQPIPFSHALHAGQFEIDCLYCHTGTDRSQTAGVPSVELCMGCHTHFGRDLEGVQELVKYWEEGRPVPWLKIHRLPEHVRFRHNRHLAAGIDCATCHGPVETMDKLAMTPDTRWWPWLLPTQKLEMGWCVQCHRENNASTDCLACHY